MDLKRLMFLDRRWLYVVILLCAGIPLIFNFGLSVVVTKPVQDVYDYIENIPEDGVILLSCDYDPGTEPELYPATLAMARHIMKRPIRLIGMSLHPNGFPLADRALTQASKETGKVYGKDFVLLSYKPGWSILMVQMNSGIAETFETDMQGDPLAGMEVMRGVRNYQDIDLILDMAASQAINSWIQQVGSRFNVPIAGAVTAVIAPELYPYLQSGQLVGVLSGLRGAAEYEKLLGVPGKALSGMESQTVCHIAIILFIVLGNAIYFVQKRREKKTRRSK